MYTDLVPVYDHHKSFYGKAYTMDKRRGTVLYSYSTAVLLDTGNAVYRRAGQPESVTTARHMREYLAQRDGVELSMAQLRKLPVATF